MTGIMRAVEAMQVLDEVIQLLIDVVEQDLNGFDGRDLLVIGRISLFHVK